jgi:hypothetical protein
MIKRLVRGSGNQGGWRWRRRPGQPRGARLETFSGGQVLRPVTVSRRALKRELSDLPGSLARVSPLGRLAESLVTRLSSTVGEEVVVQTGASGPVLLGSGNGGTVGAIELK